VTITEEAEFLTVST